MTLSYNTEEYQTLESGLPDGTYKVYIADESFLTENANLENPNPLRLTFEVIEGEHKGRTHSELYSINHASNKARDISRGRLKLLAEKSGGVANSTNPFKGRTLFITLKKKGDYTNITNVKADAFGV